MKERRYSFQVMLLLQFLGFFICANSFSQDVSITGGTNNVINIHILSGQGVLLDSGWKFHTGDDIRRAAADFDDSQWELLNPTKEAKQYRQIMGRDVGWLRLHFSFDSDLRQVPVFLRIEQNVASEIYLDGNLVAQYGTLNNDAEKAKGFKPLNQSLPLTFNFSRTHVLAVRICLPEQTTGLIYPRLNNSLFYARLVSWSQKQELERNHSHNSFSMSLLKASLLIFMLFKHFSFYLFYRKEKITLYLGLFEFFTSIAYILYALLVYRIHDMQISNLLRVPGTLFFTVGSWFLLEATYSAFNKKRGIVYRIFFMLMFLVAIIYFTPLNGIISRFGNLQIFWYPLLITAESIRLPLLSVLKKKGVKKNPIAAVMTICAFSLAVLVIALQVNDITNHTLSIMFEILIYTALLGFIISSFLYVAIEFKYYYRNLMKAQALRNKIAIDLHDDLGTKLSTVRMFLKSLKGNQTIQTKNDTVLLDNSLSLLDTSIDDLRQVMNELKAPILIDRGYIAATEELINSINQLQQINFSLSHSELSKRMEQKTEYNLFRITQELINNTLKYADAKNVSIDIVNRDDKIIFMYEDDGKGFDVQSPKKGFGLSNIMTRAKALGAEVTFDSKPGTGFRTIIEMPIIYA